jgi:microcystin-dependent protein
MSDQYLGEVRPFGGNFAPEGWALCNGALLSINSYTALFSLIGTTYGGDGQSTFGLPNLQGRALIHVGSGAGLSTYVMGEQVGVETVTISAATMPSHQHSFGASGGGGTTPTPGPGVVLAGTPTGNPIYDGTVTPVALSGAAVTTAGGSTPHDNRQPYLAITYIIALSGVFPSQN